MNVCLRMLLLAAAVLASLPMVPAVGAATPERPNVLLIVADDLNNDLASYGHPLVQTPHLDALAKRGVLFEKAYCQNPVCNPSRTSFLSGLRPGTKVRSDATFLPEYLHDHGYYTVEMGKLTHSYGVTATAISWDAQEKRSTPQRLSAMIDEAQAEKKPFFIGVGLTHTHPGFSFERDVLAQYPEDKLALPDEPDDFRSSVPAEAYDKIAAKPLPDDERRAHIARYYAAITTLDARVGELLAVLDDRRLAEGTIVVFTSDHGRHLGEHGGIYDKRTLFENSARVPLIVAAAGRAPAGRSPRLVELVDLFPTLAELCGLPVPGQLEGTSLVPLLDDPAREWKTAAFTSSFVGKHAGHSVRTKRYRYAQWRDGQAAFLFDYETDPAETRNLVGQPGQVETVARMKQILEAGWRAARP